MEESDFKSEIEIWVQNLNQEISESIQCEAGCFPNWDQYTHVLTNFTKICGK